MATDVLDNQEMKEAQRDYLDFLDDDVSAACCSVTRFGTKSTNEAIHVLVALGRKKKSRYDLFIYFIDIITMIKWYRHVHYW